MVSAGGGRANRPVQFYDLRQALQYGFAEETEKTHGFTISGSADYSCDYDQRVFLNTALLYL